MKNPIKQWRERRRQKKELKKQRELFQTWALLESIFQIGQLSFDSKSNRLFITQPLATLLMARGAEGWVNSISAIYQYLYWQQAQKAWGNFFHEEELAAVRHALVENPNMQRIDIDRIKRARRAEIAMTDMEPPKVEPFEFFILPDSTEASVEPIAIGYFDPETGEMEVATWEEVKPLLQKKDK